MAPPKHPDLPCWRAFSRKVGAVCVGPSKGKGWEKGKEGWKELVNRGKVGWTEHAKGQGAERFFWSLSGNCVY